MRSFRLTALALGCAFLASHALAQSPQQVAFWKQAVAEKSLPEIAKFMSHGATPSWPEAHSLHFVQNLSGEKRTLAEDAVALVRTLHTKAQRDFNPVAKASSAEIRTYAALASALEKSGGYSNMLLADSFRRLAILRISESLVRGSRPAAEARQDLEQIEVPHIEARGLLERLALEDEALSSNRSELGKITSDQNIYAALQAAGLGDGPSLMGKTFSQLMDNASAAALLVRMAGTEMLYNVSLKGLVAFIEKGGTYQELDPADVRPFKNRMGGTEKSFRYPLLDVRYLRGGDLRVLFELQNEPASRAAFLKAIFE